MKNLIVVLCILFTSILTLPSLAIGAEYMVGVRTGYFAWQPFIHDIEEASGFGDITWGTGVLYGPIFSVMFTDDLSFSLSALFGNQSTHWQSKFSTHESGRLITGNYYFETFRADVDSAISYRISQYFKIFAGYKYQYLSMELKYTELRTDDSPLHEIHEINVAIADPQATKFHGPALGIGFTYPLTEHYFMSMNVSGLYMKGDFLITDQRINWDDSGSYSIGPIDKLIIPMRQIGVNVEPVLGMNPGNNLPIVTVGVRYQRSRLQITDLKDGMPDKWFDDTIIGAFISIVFMF